MESQYLQKKMIIKLLAKTRESCHEDKYLMQHTQMVINFGMFLGEKLFNEYKKKMT